MSSNALSQKYPWRLFWVLFAAGVFALVAVIPVALEIVSPVGSRVGPSPFPLPLVVLIGAVQNHALLAVIVWLGIKLSRRLGLAASLLESSLRKQPETSHSW